MTKVEEIDPSLSDEDFLNKAVELIERSHERRALDLACRLTALGMFELVV